MKLRIIAAVALCSALSSCMGTMQPRVAPYDERLLWLPLHPESWVGEGEDDVRNVYAARSTDAGVVYRGGSGRRRLYFALGDGTQVWFDLDRDGTVELAGGPEPKTRWVRYNGDSITVEESP